ncbi:MAG: response regulator transcription factor [Terracidiphilus sp.]|jgi:DNA-binding response OmpR family regulator
MRILVIEDEVRMLELLRKGLYESGYTVMIAADGEAGLEAALAHEFDAIVLDIGLPQRDGYSVAQSLRQRKSATPILILTARDAEDDIIRGLDLGADDYMTKPFSFAELVARIQSITRPQRSEAAIKIDSADLVVDPARQLVTRGDASIELTRTEFALFGRLVRSAGSCVSRESLTECIWGDEHEVGPGALDVLVSALRRKIDAPFKQKLIRTVRGEGYALRVQPVGAGDTN